MNAIRRLAFPIAIAVLVLFVLFAQFKQHHTANLNLYHVGDVVQLNSGGPPMTVIQTWDTGWVRCAQPPFDPLEFPPSAVHRVNVSP